ncbi:MAG: hypothetical protein HUU50_00620 [Candidatus Brocadiae bacterium]|nr:hypothetical protein [Candidatus Brocadiia bacterium]
MPGFLTPASLHEFSKKIYGKFHYLNKSPILEHKESIENAKVFLDDALGQLKQTNKKVIAEYCSRDSWKESSLAEFLEANTDANPPDWTRNIEDGVRHWNLIQEHIKKFKKYYIF